LIAFLTSDLVAPSLGILSSFLDESSSFLTVFSSLSAFAWILSFFSTD